MATCSTMPDVPVVAPDDYVSDLRGSLSGNVARDGRPLHRSLTATASRLLELQEQLDDLSVVNNPDGLM